MITRVDDSRGKGLKRFFSTRIHCLQGMHSNEPRVCSQNSNSTITYVRELTRAQARWRSNESNGMNPGQLVHSTIRRTIMRSETLFQTHSPKYWALHVHLFALAC